jgi:hypothetical protein
MDYETLNILAVAQAPGPCSDLRLFRKSSLCLPAEVWYLADGGYRGPDALHPQTAVPVRKPRGGCLSKQHKNNNRRLPKSAHRVRTFRGDIRVTQAQCSCEDRFTLPRSTW